MFKSIRTLVVGIFLTATSAVAQGMTLTFDPGVTAGTGACRAMVTNVRTTGWDCTLPSGSGASVPIGAAVEDRWIMVLSGDLLVTVDGAEQGVRLGKNGRLHVPGGRSVTFLGRSVPTRWRVTNERPQSNSPSPRAPAAQSP